MPADAYETAAPQPYQTVGPAEAKELLAQGARVIDVRWPSEWQQGHIPGATLLPLSGIYTFGQALRELQLAPSEKVIFVCAVGQRSAIAAEIASLLGFQQVYNLASGMHGWLLSGYPIEQTSSP
ncbi:rhodanese-like domain-containing protein [Thermogemmatispora sp.]|uniref:rhodanese-like domain-containing protein n=1 Tax=Thermogemmatispora sp. TaxID=1968838 RepID=UPI001D3C8845|nr:rhodanese-like domain-containing protein [Thermogemmatispora sp.]MBX5449952.1 rhodanese-like domain-containing protein [Thermogemmatispora sp.]